MNGGPENSEKLYRIDAGRSNFTVQAFAVGLLSFMGHNPAFAVRRYGGEVLFSDTMEPVSMLLAAQADTLAILGRVSEKDLFEIENTMRGEVLETEIYPEIFFVSKNISIERISERNFLAEIDGTMSLHGMVRRHVIAADAEINGELVRARGEFVLRLSDYNIKPVKALGGTLKVKDEVEISFDIVAQA